MSGNAEREAGFSLVELMISLVLAAIVMATVYSSYTSQQRTYVTQEQVAMMQQNLRAALYHLERDIRMAGYDPTGKAGAGISTAPAPTATTLHFTKDDNNNADTKLPDGDVADLNEDITYNYDSVKKRITRGGQPIAENIDAMDFVYIDENGAITATTSAIRSVQIAVVARTAKRDPGYKDTTIYTNAQGNTIYPTGGVYAGDDNRYRRNILRIEVRCRNIGMAS